MITGMNHTGFVVRNLDKAVEFYRQVLGLKVVRATDREGAPISQVVGYENTHLKGALLSLGDGHALELLHPLFLLLEHQKDPPPVGSGSASSTITSHHLLRSGGATARGVCSIAGPTSTQHFTANAVAWSKGCPPRQTPQ